jgi:type I restriction enzyme R subunit
VAADLVQHIDARYEANAGKVMIVTMSRRIAVDLYDQLAALKPEWASDDDATGAMKVIMTGSASDDEAWQPHIRNKEKREALANRFKDPDDPFRIVIVRDMWLTGFDAPSLHTLYVDKPMKGHGLMQAIARVNRVFESKTGGLVVDYLGIANNLKEALRIYANEGLGSKSPVENQTEDEEFSLDRLIGGMLTALERCREDVQGFDYLLAIDGSPAERLQTVTNAQEFLILQNGYKGTLIDRFLDHATALLKSFALASATPQAQKIKREVAFFQTVKVTIAKTTGRANTARDERLDHAVRQLVDEAIAPDGVVDIFAAAGLQKPNIAVLSDAFLDEVRNLPQKNLALEMLKKLLNDEISARQKTSIVQSRKFSERLEQSLNSYHNRGLEMAQIIDAMIQLAKEFKAAANKGEELGLKDDEYAFYEALAENASAQAVMQDDQLLTIAREVATTVRTTPPSTGANVNRSRRNSAPPSAGSSANTATHPTRPPPPSNSSSNRPRPSPTTRPRRVNGTTGMTRGHPLQEAQPRLVGPGHHKPGSRQPPGGAMPHWFMLRRPVRPYPKISNTSHCRHVPPDAPLLNLTCWLDGKPVAGWVLRR